MENAVDALKMAAGVLIALLLTSLIVYIFTVMSNLEDTKAQAELIDQTAKFNAQFNAFEKTSMYGTDLISVLSLAYNNNMDVNSAAYKRFDGHYDEDREGAINIVFILKNPILGRTTETVYTIDNGATISKDGPKTVGTTETVFAAGEYSLKATDVNDANIQKIKKIIIDGKKEVTVTNKDERKVDPTTNRWIIKRTETVKSATGYDDFKKTIFEYIPEETKYDGTGRIKSMTFTEKETN